jgi:hypothetical protein
LINQLVHFRKYLVFNVFIHATSVGWKNDVICFGPSLHKCWHFWNHVNASKSPWGTKDDSKSPWGTKKYSKSPWWAIIWNPYKKKALENKLS